MAHHVEPMDVDCMDSEFDNKENTYNHSNVLPCTEKGYEELDLSEINMKLRYSMTPASSPMSKSYTASIDNRNNDADGTLNVTSENSSLTRSLSSTLTKNDNVIKSLKSLPLQSLPTEQFIDGNGNASVLRQLDSTITNDGNVTVTVSGQHDINENENFSLPSSSSSALHTPDATTPTKDMVKDGGSPIMRGLKSVFNMFRPSQSPIPPADDEVISKQEVASPQNLSSSETKAVASTPIAAHRSTKDGSSSKRSSPIKDSIVFNDDLQTELNWKDETTILFSHEKIPIHKLCFQSTKFPIGNKPVETDLCVQNTKIASYFNTTVEYMDISYEKSMTKDTTIFESPSINKKNETFGQIESDGEFEDCETTITKNESQLLDFNETQDFAPPAQNTIQNIIPVNNNTPEVKSIGLDITSISFTEENKNDVTEPSEYSDYSKETTELLSELKNLEENVSSKEQLPNEQENNTAIKHSIENQSEVIATVIDDKLELVDETTEPELKTLVENVLSTEISIVQQNTTDHKDVAENQDGVIVPVKEDNRDLICESTELSESTTACENVSSKEDISNEQKNMTETVDTIENLLTVIAPMNEDKEDLKFETTVILSELNKVEKNTTKDVIENQSEFIDSEKEDLVSESTELLSEPQNKGDKVSSNDEISNVLQNTNDNKDFIKNQSKVIDTVNNEKIDCIIESKVEEVNPTKEEASHREIVDANASGTADGNILNLTNSLGNYAGNTTNDETNTSIANFEDNINTTVTVNEHSVISLNVEPVRIKPQDTTLTTTSQDEVNVTQSICSDSIDLNLNQKLQEATFIQRLSDIENNPNIPTSCLSTDATTLANINVTSECSTNSVILSEIKPADVPLPNEDLPTEEIEFVPTITIAMTNELNITETLNKSSADVIDETNIGSTLLSDTTSELFTALVDAQKATNITMAISVEKPIETFPNIRIDHDAGSANLNNVTIHGIDVEVLNRDTKNMDMTQTLDKTVHETKIGDNATIPEIVPSSNQTLTFNQTYEMNANTTQVIANLAEGIDTGNTSGIKDDSKYTSIKTQDIEPMDISMTEIVNEIRDISDSHTKTEEAPQDVLMAIEAVTVSNPEILSVQKADIVSKIETSSGITGVEEVLNIEPKIKCVPIQEPNLSLLDNTSADLESQILPILDNMSNDINKQVNVDHSIKKDTTTHEIHDFENTEVKMTTTYEEILVSENNSPYVSVISSIETNENKVDTFEEIEIPLPNNTNRSSSPPITSKGYNFNFDEIDDPFATKTKVGLTPPLDTPTKRLTLVDEKGRPHDVSKKGPPNRRKSQPPERNKAGAMKKNLNATIGVGIASKTLTNITAPNDDINVTKINSETTSKILPEQLEDMKIIESNIEPTQELNEKDDVFKQSSEDVSNSAMNKLERSFEARLENDSSKSMAAASNEFKATSSSKQSTYHTASASSTDSFKAKNVFNLPEIDDVNFNPFATKSKMCQSPPPNLEIDNPFTLNTKIARSPDTSMIVRPHLDINSTNTIPKTDLIHPEDQVVTDEKMETELMEKGTLVNTSNNSTKIFETHNLNNHEVNTEDEDTIEGPFLEPDDAIDKITDFEIGNEDMMHFNDLPTQENDDNMEGELFIDAKAFDFLLNQNKTNVVSDSGRESLFLKFDPLFAKRISSVGVLAALNNVQNKQSTSTKLTPPSLRSETSPVAGPSTLNATYTGDVSIESNEDNIPVSKPMMVVTPAVNPAVTPRHKSITPTKSNRRSVTFTSPAIAVIDGLLSLSANNSLVGHDTTTTSPNREQNEAALTQLRELLAEKEISVNNLRSESRELKDRLTTMESQVKILETDGQERLSRINELNDRHAEKIKINKKKAALVEEYERMIASLIAEIEQDKKRNAEERIRLINDRDEQLAHLASMEASFSDLHSKYEKSKQIILACKANEDTYKKSIEDFEVSLSKMQANYESLKQHATSKLNHANQEFEKLNRAHEAEVVKFKAMIKRKDLHITSLEETLTQKTKANEELTAICDELINKVG